MFWRILFSKTFFAIGLALSTIALAYENGWAEPKDWLLGVVDAYRAATHELTQLALGWVPNFLSSWNIDQFESDVIWLMGVTILPGFISMDNSFRDLGFEPAQRRIYTFSSVGLMFLTIAVLGSNEGTSYIWLPIVLAGAGLLVGVASSFDRGSRHGLLFLSHYFGGLLIFWTLYVSGILEII